MFIGRSSEIEKLNGFYEGDNCCVAVISGGVGVGKTTLLRKFSEDKDVIYIDAYETTEKQQRKLISKQLGIDENSEFSAICENIKERATDKKILLIIEQYQNIVKADASFDKTLYEYVCGAWKDLPIKLVLASDAYLFVDKSLKGKKSLWKDILSLDLELQSFNFFDSLEFLDDASETEAAFFYGITGGMAYNLVKVQQILSTCTEENRIKEVAAKLFLDVNSSVGLNPERIMSTELRELSYYNCLLTTLASGLNRVNQISQAVEKPKDVVVPYLNSLISIGICKKDTAITETTNRKKTRYSIRSTGTLFWYKFIAENYDLYMAGDVEALWAKVSESMAEFMQPVFVKICGEYLQEKSVENMLPFTIEELGNWWVNDDEAGTTEGFDIVSLGKCEGRSATIFCECYYNKEPIEVAQLKALIEKTKQLKREGDVFYIVFSKAGFNENATTISSAIKNIMLISLDEIR